MSTPRPSKLVEAATLPELLRRWLPEGGSLCLGGLLDQNRPVALVREVIRAGCQELRLYSSPAAGYDVDLLIAAGCVAETYIPGVTLEFELAPCFRYAAEQGLIRAHGLDALSLLGGIMAAAEGVPFHPIAALKGTDLLKVNPLLRPVVSPFDGQTVYAVPPIAPDLALLHAQEADCYGNIRHLGVLDYADNLIARAARRVIVSVDRLVPPEVVRADPRGTSIAGHHVAAVVVLPYGAHPAASPPLYAPDQPHLEEYVAAARQWREGRREALQAYLQRYVWEAPDQAAYVQRVGGSDHLERLQAGEVSP